MIGVSLKPMGTRLTIQKPPHPKIFLGFIKCLLSHTSQRWKNPLCLFREPDQDLRVPISNGFQYVRALKERGVEVKVLVFSNDSHPLDRPETDYESFLNIVAVWFNKYCKL